MKKITQAGTCPSCGSNRIKRGWGWFGDRLFGTCLKCVECGTKMKPRKLRRRGGFVGVGF